MDRRRPRPKEKRDYYEEEWVPKTRLGKLVYDGQVTTFEEAMASGLPIKESRLVDVLIPGLEDEVLDINMVQRMTDSGRRVKFRTTVIVGNRDGYIGLGEGKDVQVGAAIKKGIGNAKLNMLKIKEGCGSWECGCGQPHTVPYEVMGESGSVRIVLIPAPRGLGHCCWRQGRRRSWRWPESRTSGPGLKGPPGLPLTSPRQRTTHC